MPDIGWNKGQIPSLNLILIVPDNFFPFPFQVEFDRVAVGVEGALNSGAGNLTLEHPESVDIESQLWRNDAGEQPSDSRYPLCLRRNVFPADDD